MNNGKTAREPHALDNVVTVNADNQWSRRINQWRRPMEFDERVSWLHTNHARNGNGPERFIFYLELADHYGDHDHFIGDPSEEMSIWTNKMLMSHWEMKSAFSKHAFMVLSEHFFKPLITGNDGPCPYEVLYQDPLFSKLVWFFRPYGGYGGFDNLRPMPNSLQSVCKDVGEHYVETVRKYASRFCIDAWYMLNEKWRPGWSVHHTPDPKIAWPLRREIIALMRHLNHIGLIESEQYAPTLKVFKEIILSLCEEDNIQCASEDLDSRLFVNEVIADLARKSYPWAASLFVASTKMEWHSVSVAK